MKVNNCYHMLRLVINKSVIKNIGSVALVAGIMIFAMSTHSYAQGGAPPVDSFNYYSTPGACVEAIRRSDAFYWRTTPDTIQFSMTRDTMLTVSAELASVCAKQFPVNEVPPRDLIQLAAVHLASGDDAAAERAIERRIQSESGASAGVRARSLQGIAAAYLNASPARVEVALRYLDQLDAIAGEEAALARFQAHLLAQRYFWRSGNDASFREHADRAIVATKQMNTRDRNEFGVYMAEIYKLLAHAEGARTGTAEAPRAVIQRARENFSTLSFGSAMMEKPDTIASMYGRPGPKVQADHWLGEITDTLLPAPGRFTVIVFRPDRTSVATLSRLHKRYGDQIAIVGVISTVGYFRDDGPLEVEEELKLLERYYIDELGMPGVMAVSETRFTKMPDGRRRAPLDPTSRAYWTPASAVAVVLDRDGIIRRVFTETWRPWFETQIIEFIDGSL